MHHGKSKSNICIGSGGEHWGTWQDIVIEGKVAGRELVCSLCGRKIKKEYKEV